MVLGNHGEVSAVMRPKPWVAWVAVAAVIVPALAHAQQAPPAYAADAVLYMHRDFTLTADPPTAEDDAVFAFGPTALAVRFESPALQQPWALRGSAALRLTLGNQVDALGRLSAALDLDGEPFAQSNTADLLADFRPREVELLFQGLEGTIPVGRRLGLTVQIEPAAAVLGPDGPVSLTDVLVELHYDSTARPGRLDVMGVDDPSASGAPGTPGRPGATGPQGPAGTSTTGTNGTGADGGDGGAGDGLQGLPVPLEATSGSVDPYLVMSGVGTSAVAMVAGLALRGRRGLG